MTSSKVELRHRSVGQRGQVAELSGEIDLDNAEELQHCLLEVLHRERPELIVDLRDVRCIDSSGLAVLLRVRRRAHELGGWLRVVCNHRPILRLFDVTGIGRVIPVHMEMDGAMQER
ncbi:MAG: STAS domain-containing protein [Candidatus Xenobia bacterium]